MRNIIVLICLFYITNWSLFSNGAFAENPQDTDDVIFLDEIIVSTEKDNNKETQEKKAENDQLNVNPIPDGRNVTSESNTKEENRESYNDIFNSASKYIKEGKFYNAREILSSSFLVETAGDKRAKLKEKLDEINKKLVFSPDPSPDSFVYTVKGGDTLSKIADEFNTSYELIMRINNKYRTNIRVGEHLKIIKGPFDILVDKNDFVLTLLLNDHYIKQYKIGTGKENKTPVGSFEIDEKIKNPVWYSGDGIYPFGHPKNILGTRWIGFKDKPGLYGYGIHGTANPQSIGKTESNGCIRLTNEEVEELFAFVTKDTKVTIQD